MADKGRSKPASISSSAAGRAIVMRLSTLVAVILVIALVGISFYAGFLYGSSSSSNSSAVSNSIERTFAIGLVVYISPTSITIANEENTSTQTFAITSKTLISINGLKSSASQIRSGNRVLIRVSKSNPTKAGIIIVDTNFSG